MKAVRLLCICSGKSSGFLVCFGYMSILKLDKDDPQKELEFEVKCALMETPEKRLENWFDWNIEMLEWIEERRGHKESTQVVKRT